MTDTIIIGGAGRWARSAYLPVLTGHHRLLAVADLPAAFHGQPPLGADSLELTGHISADLAILDRYRAAHPLVRALIVTTPPLLHDTYTEWGIRSGLSVICDKPPCAARNQFGHPDQVRLIEASYQGLLGLLGQHPGQRVYVPLRRRLHDPYAALARDVAKVAEITAQPLTSITIHHNNGCYRYPGEYALPGAHGYIDGLGTLTHTAYHLLDFLAFLLAQSGGPVSGLDAQIIACTTVASAWTSRHPGFDRLIGRTGRTADPPPPGASAELDLTCQYRVAWPGGHVASARLDTLQRGCTRRITPSYPPDATHDEGRVDDTVIVAHQGPLQTLVLTVTDDPGGQPGSIHVTRRVHPVLARQLGCHPVTIQDAALSSDINSRFHHDMVNGMLGAISGGDPAPYASLELSAQALTMRLYAAALRAGHSWIDDAHQAG